MTGKRYVRTDDGIFLVQGPHPSQSGFALYDDDQTWPGGFGVASTWEIVRAADVPARDRERLGWLFHERLGEK